jgi:hypothetical protein
MYGPAIIGRCYAISDYTLKFTRVQRRESTALSAKIKRPIMLNLNRLGVGGIIFLVGAVIYVINLIAVLSRRSNVILTDGVGLMVLGIGLVLVFRI